MYSTVCVSSSLVCVHPYILTWTTAADLVPQILCIGAYPTVVPSKSIPLLQKMRILKHRHNLTKLKYIK